MLITLTGNSITYTQVGIAMLYNSLSIFTSFVFEIDKILPICLNHYINCNLIAPTTLNIIVTLYK